MSTAIPSPVDAAWQLGPLTIRAYALCILAGIVLAVWIAGRRLADRGGTAEQALDIAAWAVPFGIVGGRLYHVITTPQPYFGEGGDPVRALFIWEGGLGIWGAIALGALGAWIGCRRHGVSFLDFADSAAPGVAVAQALGRWGNWFNNELYGRETDVPWAVTIHQWDQGLGRAVRDAAGDPVVLGTYHPTFLYESLWCLAGFAFIVWADRRFQLGHGRVLALYVMVYTLGRGWIELLRIDSVQMADVLGLRLNVWTSLVLFALAAVYFVVSARRHPGRESVVRDDDRGARDEPEASPAE